MFMFRKAPGLPGAFFITSQAPGKNIQQLSNSLPRLFNKKLMYYLQVTVQLIQLNRCLIDRN